MIFPTVSIIGCQVHWKRELRANLRDHHLLSRYNADMDLQMWVRHLWVLTCVPVKDVLTVWNEIILPRVPAGEDPNLDAFIQYFENTWIGGLSPRGTRNQF